MQRTKYAIEFKDEAVKQVIDKGHSVVDVVNDLKALQVEMTRLKAELRRTTEERDILKKAAAYVAKQSG